MTFRENFIRLLPWRPLQALAALYWHVTGRKVRARNRLREGAAELPFAYDLWISTVERNFELARDAPSEIERWDWRPQFSILLQEHPGSTKNQLDRSIESINEQIYPFWTLSRGSTNARGIEAAAANGDYLVPLRAGDVLSEAALFRFAEAVQRDPSAMVLYGDQDELDRRGRRTRPWFKPRWNQEMFLAYNYLADAVAIETSAARKAANETHDLTTFLLAATSAADGFIIHVPHVLCHVDARADDQGDRITAVARHLQPIGATCSPGLFGTVKVEWPLPHERPLVSIIVPTRDKLDLLRPCLDGVLGKTDYPNFEVLVLDNESVQKRTADYLTKVVKDPRVRVIRYCGRYNFSTLNNFAAAQVRGPYLCLLNNDTEIVEPTWLTEMMRYAVRPEVGAVGAKLLYDDGRIQHAGVIVGLGEAAGHAHRFLPASEPGYFRMPHVAQFISAVTAACLVVEKTKFEAVGGLDEELAVAFNDVDLCLKLEAAGWRNAYVPHAVLVHHESKTRGKDAAPQNLQRYLRELGLLQQRWGTKTYNDPLHNPNLDRHNETFIIRV